MVYVVWRDNGSKKWFPSPTGDGPSWPLKTGDKKKYRVGVRAVNVDLSGKSVELKNNVIDGQNVRKSYKMVKVTNIQTFDFTMEH